MSKMHTLAFQIDDDMYVAIKGYLDQYKLITNQKISQRSFILKLIKDQLSPLSPLVVVTVMVAVPTFHCDPDTVNCAISDSILSKAALPVV